MLTEHEYLDKYAESHRDHTNTLVHMVCVPVIVWATLALVFLVPLGRWLHLAPSVAPWVNGATVGGLLALFGFYARLSARAFVVGAAWLGLSLALSAGLERFLGPVGLGVSAAVVWVAAWVAQFIGHKIEGAKPSFLDDLQFLLVGPLFVQRKFDHLLATGSLPAH